MEIEPLQGPMSFLDPRMSAWIDHHRQKSGGWFGLINKLVDIQCRAIGQISASDQDERLCLAALLCVRGATSFQASIILAERGMTCEARTVIRSCFETLFYLGAIIKRPQFHEEMKDDDLSRKKKLARVILSVQEEGGETNLEDLSIVREFLEDSRLDRGSIREISIFEAARVAGMNPIYETYYRSLSNDGAHPSISSLLRHFENPHGGSDRAFRFDPDANDVDECASIICVAGIYWFELSGLLFGIDDKTKSDFSDTWTEYKNMVDSTEPGPR